MARTFSASLLGHAPAVGIPLGVQAHVLVLLGGLGLGGGQLLGFLDRARHRFGGLLELGIQLTPSLASITSASATTSAARASSAEAVAATSAAMS